MKNKWVSFLSKVAFICNLCFLMGLVIMYTHFFIANQAINSTVVVLGTFVSLFLTVILQVCLLVLRVGKKDIPVKPWLRIANVSVFGVQLVYYFLTSGR